MFSFMSKKTTMPGCIDLNSSEQIIPLIVEKLPSFGTKKATDRLSLFNDAIYVENLPYCDGLDRHVWSDSAMNDLVKGLLSELFEDDKSNDFEIKACYSPEHGETLIVSTKGGYTIGSLLAYLEAVAKEDRLEILAQDMYDLRVLDTNQAIASRSITKTFYMARHQECLIISYPGTPVQC